MSKLLEKMNERQKEAVQHTEGPLLIMAGAGSGKTRVLTHRIAYLVEEKHINPWNILAITFTNKAAKEMKERLELLVGHVTRDMWVSTFHSMCVRILRREAELIGYSRQFSIADTSEQKTLMKRVIKERGYDPKKVNEKVLLSVISDAKNQLLTPERMKEEASTWFEDVIADCYQDYQNLLMKNQLFDFDDLIMKTVELFEQYPDVLSYYQQKFHYIHVDEYQDTNKTQYTLVRQLSRYFKNICVVGDADQSIYGWRGADMSNILNFEKDFPNAKTVLLEQNYRSTKTILNAANNVIDNNQERVAKTLWTQNDTGDTITLYNAFSEKDEASYVAQKIKQLQTEKVYVSKYNDIAVLYRTNAQSRSLEEAFMQYAIPYKIYGGLRFYDRLEIKDILAYLRLIDNPKDDLSFERVVNVPKRSVGKTSLEKLASFARERNYSLFEATEHLEETGLGTKAKNGILSFVTLIKKCQIALEESTITQLLDMLLEKSGYTECLEMEGTLEAQARLENIQEFKSVTKTFDEQLQTENLEDIEEVISPLTRFLSDFALDGTLEEDETNEHYVTLMTLHAAKGLEFPVVFIVGMEETIFPSSRSVFEEDIEEERRLMYVGMTRAEKKLFLTHASSRLLYGDVKRNRASRFLEEISDVYVDVPENITPQTTITKPFKVPFVQKKVVTQENRQFSVGDKVKHAKWGIGRVVRISGKDVDTTIDIAFENQGIKTLLAAFAPVEKI
ncbi:DNA helicase PcrA [Granulicatella sp. zg-ZJ]|uniref:DNA helicase PcrA n=1 Tax=Granulicatella sp. zg-ZJ TaxID=2678504 RepID=UPI0013D8524D|nr:DNA helicase PcrA [Granulicatella sp. zg-ZJ]NEW63291.1 DNA helicase PcrA [Granulicatella sp. zg-ZJ]